MTVAAGRRPSTASAGQTVMAAVREYGRPLVDDPARLDGVDRARGGRDRLPGRHRRPLAPSFVTGIVDLTGRGRPRLLDVVEGPQRKGLVRLGFRPRPGVAGRRSTVAALDPFRGYATALSHLAAARDAGAGRLPRHPARLRRRR